MKIEINLRNLHKIQTNIDACEKAYLGRHALTPFDRDRIHEAANLLKGIRDRCGVGR